MEKVPDFKQYMNPILAVLKALGDSASNQELYEHVVRDMRLSDEQLLVMHPDREDQTEVAYRMGWARTYMKSAGFIHNSSRGIWTLTAKGRETDRIDVETVAEEVRLRTKALGKKRRHRSREDGSVEEHYMTSGERADWKNELLDALHDIAPANFERLCQRVLRESGFVEVNVTGRTGDGGIDGKGVLRLQKLLSFYVVFQCKRWRGSIGAREIRDFRGAMVGRTDKGIFMTTATFTPDAQREATRDGAPAIDLVDGETLVELLKELELGVKCQRVEQVTIDKEWFETL